MSKLMSEDTIESFLVDFIHLTESWPKGWADDDKLHEEAYQFALDWFEPYYTKERNYN